MPLGLEDQTSCALRGGMSSLGALGESWGRGSLGSKFGTFHIKYRYALLGLKVFNKAS